MWNDVIRKSRMGLSSTGGTGTNGVGTLPTTISIIFDNGGSQLIVGSAGAIEITFPCRIISCHLYAGNVTLQPAISSATVELKLTTFAQFAGGGVMNLTGASAPTMTDTASQDVPIGDWVTQLDPGDVLLYRLAGIAGDATWISCQIGVRRLDAPLSNVQVVDNATNTLVDGSGNTLNVRTQ
jgi:hypothetical protein